MKKYKLEKKQQKQILTKKQQTVYLFFYIKNSFLSMVQYKKISRLFAAF
jgi:hypothetical protein